MAALSNYTPWVIFLTLAINGLIAIVFLLDANTREVGFDVHVLPLVNAILNSMTTVFLLSALVAIKRKNIRVHRRFIYAAFTTTGLFLVTYLTYHSLSESTRYGGAGFLRGVYYFVLLTHIVLAALIVPLALVTFFRGINNRVAEHRAIAKWTMPLWLYVSVTGVIVYVMISPYY
jgi:putative membrane protein